MCQLLGSPSWLVDEKVHIQQMAGVSREGYVQMYKFALRKKMDVSIFLDSPKSGKSLAPSKLSEGKLFAFGLR